MRGFDAALERREGFTHACGSLPEPYGFREPVAVRAGADLPPGLGLVGLSLGATLLDGEECSFQLPPGAAFTCAAHTGDVHGKAIALPASCAVATGLVLPSVDMLLMEEGFMGQQMIVVGDLRVLRIRVRPGEICVLPRLRQTHAVVTVMARHALIGCSRAPEHALAVYEPLSMLRLTSDSLAPVDMLGAFTSNVTERGEDDTTYHGVTALASLSARAGALTFAPGEAVFFAVPDDHPEDAILGVIL